MLKFQVITKEDRKLAASIQHRRKIDTERKERIFNPRFRRIGIDPTRRERLIERLGATILSQIDKEFLDKQVAEKKQQRELEQARESELDENLIRSSKLALLLEKQQEEEKRRIDKEVEDFRRNYQRPEDRRDYDLCDPNALKKASPQGSGDSGFASAFEGENSQCKERSKVQKEETRWWIQKQMGEREMAERERQEAEKAYQEAVISRDKRAMALDQMERECRRRLTEATAKFNRALAEEQEYQRHCEALQEEEDKKAEIYNHVTGDFLTEAKEQAESSRGPSKPLASRYKGMNADQLRAFRDAQTQQLKEIERAKTEEKRMDETWDRLMNAHAESAIACQRELERQRAEANKKLAEENLKLAHQQKSHQEYLNRVVYKNKPSAEFFEQFNRDAR